MQDWRNALRHHEFLHVQRLADRQVLEIDLDELRQVAGQALDVDLVHDVVDERRGHLHRGGDVLVHEVQRHLHVDLLVRSHALEVDVRDLRLPRMHVHRTHQHLRLGALEVEREDRGLEGLVA